MKAVLGTIESTYPINSLLHVNAVMINEKKPVQFIATLAWNKDKIALTQQVKISLNVCTDLICSLCYLRIEKNSEHHLTLIFLYIYKCVVEGVRVMGIGKPWV